MLMIIVGLAFLGLCLGSFVNALVYRLHWQQNNTKKPKKQKKLYSISSGRSICPNCQHKLAMIDLIPVISWLALRGKCRYCAEPISWQYPTVELVTAGLFIASYLFWPQQLSGVNIFTFVIWLAVLIGLIALAVYDIRWMILPNRIIFPLYALVSADVIVRTASAGSYSPIISSLWGVVVGGGIFYILFQVSDGKWIGGGDVKLGFLLGAITGGPVPALLVLFLASLLGSLFSIFMMARNRLNKKTKIAFGPFLIVAAIVTYLSGEQIIELYNNLLML